MHPAHERLYHTTGVYAPYSQRTALWVLLRPTRIRKVKELWDGTYGFSCLSDNTRMSNHFVDVPTKAAHSPQLFKTLSVGPAGVVTRDLPLGRPSLIQLS